MVIKQCKAALYRAPTNAVQIPRIWNLWGRGGKTWVVRVIGHSFAWLPGKDIEQLSRGLDSVELYSKPWVGEGGSVGLIMPFTAIQPGCCHGKVHYCPKGCL